MMGLAVIVSNEWTRLDSANDGRQVFFEGDEVFAAEQNGRPAALPRLHHQDLVDIHQDLSRGWPGSLQCDENSHSGLG